MKRMLLSLFLICSIFGVMAQNEEDLKAQREIKEYYYRIYLLYQEEYPAAPRETVDKINRMSHVSQKSNAHDRFQAYLENERIDTLTVIDLTRAGLKELPDFVLKATSLQKLILDYNEITKLPTGLKQLAHLDTIIWRANALDDARWIRMPRLDHLKKLDISNNLLTRMPAGVKKMSSLEVLYAGENFFGKVPINRLKNVESLKEISFNKSHDLKIMEGKYERLSGVEIFKASQCGLTDVHPSFYGMEGLKELQLQENELVEMPDGISALTNLTKLSFYKNKLADLPSDLWQMNLKVIDLYFNELETLDESLGEMQSLELLYLANNLIYDLPESIGQLQNLEELYLHHNRLSALPSSLAQLHGMRVLRVNYNYLMEFPTQVLNMKELEYLDVGENQISTVPAALGEFEHLKMLVFNENEIDLMAEENAHIVPMMMRLQEQGVICVPLISQEDVAEAR